MSLLLPMLSAVGWATRPSIPSSKPDMQCNPSVVVQANHSSPPAPLALLVNRFWPNLL